MHVRAAWSLLVLFFATSLLATDRRPAIAWPPQLEPGATSGDGVAASSIRTLDTATVTDPAGDLRGNQQLVTVGGSVPPTGTTATILVQKWSVSGCFSGPNNVKVAS